MRMHVHAGVPDGCLCMHSCRAGAQEMRLALPKLWPAEQAAASPELRRMAICGEAAQELEEVSSDTLASDDVTVQALACWLPMAGLVQPSMRRESPGQRGTGS